MRQLSLFSRQPPAVNRAGGVLLDAASERLLDAFGAVRLAQGAHPRSVKREVSQLRAVALESGGSNQVASLAPLFADLGRIARVLREPEASIARATGRARLLAVQRFIRLMGPALGRDPAGDLAALDSLLPARRPIGWHSAGTLVAGTLGRRRRRGPTLEAADLRRILDAAAEAASDGLAARDRALVALHCFSGLRPEEIVGLRWEDLSTEPMADGRSGMTAAVDRGGRRIPLPLPRPAAEPIGALAQAMGTGLGVLRGPLFQAYGSSVRALSYRAARYIVKSACRRAGLPTVEAAQLRAACAHWLRSQGLSDHEVAAVMGLTRVRSLDRLLRCHAALDAQRVVRELVEP